MSVNMRPYKNKPRKTNSIDKHLRFLIVFNYCMVALWILTFMYIVLH